MTEKPDGEVLVSDAAVSNPIPAESTWKDLTANQLIDAKVRLQNHWYESKNPQLKAMLSKSISKLSSLIEAKL